jgi:hypothetical protein
MEGAGEAEQEQRIVQQKGPAGTLLMAVKIDIYDSEPWTEMDVEDLTAALRSGDTIEDAAKHICRSGTVEDVRRKAEELGLSYKSCRREG